MTLSRSALALASLFFSLSCSSPAPDNPPGPGGPTGASCPPNSPYTFQSFAQKFFSDYCVRCHGMNVTGADRNGAPPDINFDDYTSIMAVDRALIDSVAAAGPDSINTFMPRSDPRPSDAERYELGEWLACSRP